MYCNTACSAAEPKEICLQCFNRHLKSRCSRKMRLLREKQSFKCCEHGYPYQGQQPYPGAGVGSDPQTCWLNTASEAITQGRVSTRKLGKEQSKKQPSSPWACWFMCFSAKYRDQKLLLSFRHIHCLHPPSCSCLETLSARFTLYLVKRQG